MLREYIHKEIWGRRGKNFLIEVVRWETLPKEKWNVYCYIYPSHPLFSRLQSEDMFDCPIENFHGGCTYVNWFRNKDGEVTCKQYGCDYNHYMDERFTFIENPERASQVFCDAEALFKELEVM